MSADSADKVLNPNVGQSVLVFFKFLGYGEGGEWSRGTVESVLEEEKLVAVHFTDYGYRGLVKAEGVRSMSCQERRMPVQVRDVLFKLPSNNKELRAIRNDLDDSGLLMRVDQIMPIGHPEELEQIIVSIWKVVDVGGNISLTKVC